MGGARLWLPARHLSDLGNVSFPGLSPVQLVSNAVVSLGAEIVNGGMATPLNDLPVVASLDARPSVAEAACQTSDVERRWRNACSGPDEPMQQGFNIDGAAVSVAAVLLLACCAPSSALVEWLCNTFSIRGVDDRITADAMVPTAVAVERAISSRLLSLASLSFAMGPSGQAASLAVLSDLTLMAGRPFGGRSPICLTGVLPSSEADANA